MRIIDPSFEILKPRPHLEQIEMFGRVAYQSEPSGDPLKFYERMRDRGHNSVLEGAVITLELLFSDHAKVVRFISTTYGSYLKLPRLDTGIGLFVTGSVRAWREWLTGNYKRSDGHHEVLSFLKKTFTVFFDDVEPENDVIDGAKPSYISIINRGEVEDYQAYMNDFNIHYHVMVKFIVNRAVSHEIVRHRPCSFLQESQRYCRYSEDKFGNEVSFIKPMFFAEGSPEYALWFEAMHKTEQLYLKLLKTSTPQAARTVLPNSCKTELIVYTNIKEWRHIFSLRTAKDAEPSMREVMIPLQEEFKKRGWL